MTVERYKKNKKKYYKIVFLECVVEVACANLWDMGIIAVVFSHH